MPELFMNIDNWLLKQYLPSGSEYYCFQLWEKYRFQLKITKPRKTKLGDYRFRADQKNHLITINGDLNPYAFLVVYLHEVAHCITTINHGLGVRPHGAFWQQEMMRLSGPLMERNIFPDDIESALKHYLKAPKAASCSHPALTKALRNYDPQSSQVALEQLPDGTEFVFQSKRYRKKKARRTRVSCQEVNSTRVYSISKLALVKPLGNTEPS